MEPIVFLLLVVSLIYTIIFFLHLLWTTRRVEKQLTYYYYGIAFFLITFCIARILFITNDTLYIDSSNTQTSETLYILGNFFANIAVFGIMLVVEKYVIDKKLKFIPSVIILISAILVLALPQIGDIYMINIYGVISALMAVCIPFLYMGVGYRLSGRSRTKSFILAIGLVVFMFSSLFYMDALQQPYPIFAILSPIMLMIGLGILHYGLLFYDITK